MQLLVCSDIFGETPALHALLDALDQNQTDIRIISPYHNTSLHGQAFDDEAQAYAAFTEIGGMSAYQAKLTEQLTSVNTPANILGFSAGGSVTWLVQESLYAQISSCLLFYPGQIRHYLELSAKVPVNIVFPAQETHFDIVSVANSLIEKPLVDCQISKYDHGFMNRHSDKFDLQGYAAYLLKIQQWIGGQPDV